MTKSSLAKVALCVAIIASTMNIEGMAFGQQNSATTKIVSVSNSDNGGSEVALGEKLKVKVDGPATLNPDYVLYLEGKPIKGIDVTAADEHTLVFGLLRTDANASIWNALLGSPIRRTVSVTVALGTPSNPTIFGDGVKNKFDLAVAPPWRLFLCGATIIVVILLVYGGARRTTLLKDNLLPQLSPAQQTYSLGRWQMALWFILVFASFVSLFALLWDFHSIVSTQALWLMGISGATGVGSIAVDVAKDSPADVANRALQALGLYSYADVDRIRLEIADRQAQLKANPALPADVTAKLGLEIRDRELLLRAYENTIRPFRSEGWFRDVTTDQNGMSLPRLQTFCWTCALGVVFLFGVYTNLAMPQFDATLLLLMGVSNAGYIGFKYPEHQQ